MDWLLHAAVAIAMVLLLFFVPNYISVPLAVVMYWYGWELGQRIAKDVEKKGALYWWNITRWSKTARWEFLAPAISSIITYTIIYVVIRTI